MHLLFTPLVLAVAALAQAPWDSILLPEDTTGTPPQFGNDKLKFDCNPPFPKASWPGVDKTVNNLGILQPKGGVISSPVSKHKRRALGPDFIISKNPDLLPVYEPGPTRVREYEVEGKHCQYIAAIDDAGTWLCNDTKETKPYPFKKVHNAVILAARACVPSVEDLKATTKACEKEVKSKYDLMPCARSRLPFAVQAWHPEDGWNIIIRKSVGHENPLVEEIGSPPIADLILDDDDKPILDD